MKSDKNPHAVALGKLGGQQRTKAKIDAARENGKKGGRPKKFDQKETVKRIAEFTVTHYE